MSIQLVTNTNDNGLGSLRAAIAAAAPGDTIAFSPLLANQTITLTSGQITIPPGKSLIIDGSAAPNLAISGNNSSRIFYVQSTGVQPTTFTVQNLTLANAYTNGNGGAIYAEFRANTVINNVTFNANTADNGGGGIYSAWESNLSVNNSRFTNNVATAGNNERGAGGIAFVSPGTFTVTNSVFEGNKGINGAAINSLNGKLTIDNTRFLNNDTTAGFYDTGNLNPFLRGYGGALYTDRASSTTETAGTIRITNSVFEGNRGKGEGGAAYLFTANGQDNVIIDRTQFVNNSVQALGGSGARGNGGGVVILANEDNKGVSLSNTTFANNTATNQGGGLWLSNAPATIANSTFSGNRALATDFNGNGGAINVSNAATNIVNSTFANNYAGWVGGAISAGNDPVTVSNTIFAANTAFNGGNPWNILQQTNRNLTDGGGNFQYPPGTSTSNNVTATITIADPLLGPLQLINGVLVHPLLAGSPAIDGGVNSGLATDQSGQPRPQDGDLNGSTIIDSGAYEYPGVALPEITLLDGATNILDGSTTPLSFGTVYQGQTLTRTFTLQNSGTAPLTFSPPTLPTGFTLLGPLPASLAAGATTTIAIGVDTTTAGLKSGTFNLVNNDSDENPFDFVIQAEVLTPMPEIAIRDGATNADIPDGSPAVIDFGSTLVGQSLSRSFTITNSGIAPLTLTPPTLPAGFSLAAPLPPALAGGASLTFTINVDTSVANTYSGEFALTNNDSDENPFNFIIQAAVNTPLPEIALFDGTTNIVDGTTTAIDFGAVLVGQTLSRSFTVTNTGTATLDLTNLTLPPGFSLVGAGVPGSLAVGGSTTLNIQVDTSALNTYSGTFALTNNDLDESVFDFAIAATVRGNTAPTVATAIADQTTNASVPFSYTIPGTTFSDADGDPLSYTATLAGGAPLPTWLVFDPATGTFSGTPTDANVGTLTIDLTAADGFDGNVTDTFVLTINPTPPNVITGTNASETLAGTAGKDLIYGLDGQDVITAGNENDQVFAGGGQDRVWGGLNDDVLHGEAGADQLWGEDGNDALFGGEGDDLLYGGAGSDRLRGGFGSDVLLGGGDSDLFILAAGEGTDVIKDFRLGEDKIGLANGLTLGQISVVQRSGETWVYTTQSREILARLEGVVATDLMAQSATAFQVV